MKREDRGTLSLVTVGEEFRGDMKVEVTLSCALSCVKENRQHENPGRKKTGILRDLAVRIVFRFLVI